MNFQEKVSRSAFRGDPPHSPPDDDDDDNGGG